MNENLFVAENNPKYNVLLMILTTLLVSIIGRIILHIVRLVGERRQFG